MLSIFSPSMARSAGSNEIAATIMTATPMAMATAKPLTNARPTLMRPRRATITVMPANTTARPEVSMASTMESSTDMPSWSASRKRVTMKSA